jgi:hypothetical protein
MTSSLFGQGWRKYSLVPLSRSGRPCPLKDGNPARPNHTDFMACDYNIETLYQDRTGHLGLDTYRMRSTEAIGKHWCLVFVA